MEILNWAQSQGGVAINYLDATDISIDAAAIRAVEVRDRESRKRRYQRKRSMVRKPGCKI
jgi:glycerol-3-phosphate dehydrogenase